ncbi:hypothetical protein Ddc_16655 [Ditylenchus destructor]|nr:hypothetical protein Ddc_16655 [Ditylenchus destructor]
MQILSARPVPIASSHREEAIGVSHARIRAATGKLAPPPNPGFSGFPEAINPGIRKSCRRDRYQSLRLTERKRLVYHTPGSERRLESLVAGRPTKGCHNLVDCTHGEGNKPPTDWAEGGNLTTKPLVCFFELKFENYMKMFIWLCLDILFNK